DVDHGDKLEYNSEVILCPLLLKSLKLRVSYQIYLFDCAFCFNMALDPVKHNYKKDQDILVAHAGAWTQDASSSPSKSVISKIEERVEASKKNSGNKN
ncbi:hypothetical protein FocTR4_00003916, partial [Fusarium oxysporum f. sp. cubense]